MSFAARQFRRTLGFSKFAKDLAPGDVLRGIDDLPFFTVDRVFHVGRLVTAWDAAGHKSTQLDELDLVGVGQ